LPIGPEDFPAVAKVPELVGRKMFEHQRSLRIASGQRLESHLESVRRKHRQQIGTP